MNTQHSKTRTHVRHLAAAMLAGLLLGGCGLASGGGSVDAGAKYQAKGEYRAAYIEAKKVLQKNDKDGEAWLLLGQSSMMLGNPKDSLIDLEKAKSLGVSDERLAVPMGRALMATRDPQKVLSTLPADGVYSPAVKAQVDALRGDAFRELRQVDDARKAYQAALTVNPNSVPALVGLARLSAVTKDRAAAERYVQQALAAAPDNPQALVAKADLAGEAGDLAAAEATYQQAVNLKNPDWLPQEHYYAMARLANVQVQKGEYDKALASIETLEKMSAEMPFPHYLKAVVLYQQNHLDKAVEELQAVMKVAPNDPQAQMLMGMVNYAQGNYPQAEMYLSNVLGVAGDNVEARRLMALTYFREGRQQQALDTLRPAVPGKPTDAELVAVLQRAVAEHAGEPGAKAPEALATQPGTSNPLAKEFAPVEQALASGNHAEAIRLLQAMPAGDAAMEAQRNIMLVSTYVQDKQVDQAVKAASAYADKNPKVSGAHLLYGTTLIAAGKRDEARAQYDEAVKLDPKNVAALMSMGSLDAMEGKLKDATNRYQDALQIDPKNGTVMTALGRLAMMQGDKPAAVKWFGRAIEAAPKAPSAYALLAALQTSSGQHDDAVETAKKFVAAFPDNPMALNTLGASQLAGSHPADAIPPLRQAVKLAPAVPLYAINLARAQILDKDPKAAAATLDTVLKAAPENVEAVALRAYLKLQDHDVAGAVALSQTLQRQPATAVQGFAMEGDLYMADKEYAKAVQTYQRGLKAHYDRSLVLKAYQAMNAAGMQQSEGVLRDWLAKNPDDASIRMLLGQYYLDHAQLADAATEYEQVMKQFPENVSVLNNLAWVYTEQHNPKAVELAEKAHNMAPDSPGIADTYGWALIAANQAQTALPILERAAKAAPKSPDIQYHLAVAQARTGDKAAARATLDALQKSGADFKDKPAAAKLLGELGSAN